MERNAITTAIALALCAITHASCRSQRSTASTTARSSIATTVLQDTARTTSNVQQHTTLTVTYIPLTHPIDTMGPMQAHQQPTTVHQPAAPSTTQQLAQLLSTTGGGTIIIQEEQTTAQQEQTQTIHQSITQSQENQQSQETLREIHRSGNTIALCALFAFIGALMFILCLKIFYKP